jgi:DNA modification methylase/endonuclease YncB( thermonuclease family)
MDNWAKVILGDSRSMAELEDATLDLVVTSPPYWHIKDYGAPGQIGYGQTLHDYLRDLYRVWQECFRVLRPGARLCLNIGDQFARAAVYGRYKVIPLHAEFIAQGEKLGFDFLGSVIWQKKTTMNPTGGATVMGSYPYPPNGLIEIDYEYIHVFKKPGQSKKVSTEVKEASRLTKEEWKEYFAGHWHFGGARQLGHEAMFPEELPRRLIRMFTFRGDTVLDPFLGSGTTVKVALELGRHAVGYEINEQFLDIIREKIGLGAGAGLRHRVEVLRPNKEFVNLAAIDYTPKIRDAGPRLDLDALDFKPQNLAKVTQVLDETTIKLDNGLRVRFLGVRIDRPAEAKAYLTRYLLGKRVSIQDGSQEADGMVLGYVYLKNKIFVNAHLIKSGLGSPEPTAVHELRDRFIRYQEERYQKD